MTKAIPEGFHTVTPHLRFRDARKAIEFYKRAFGATERFAMPGPDGKGIMHAELLMGNSIIMLGEENPNEPCKSADTMGGSPVSFYIYLENVDEAFRKALEAGAVTRMPLQDIFWGDRVGAVQDTFGYIWNIATHTKDLTAQELEEGARAAFTRTAKK